MGTELKKYFLWFAKKININYMNVICYGTVKAIFKSDVAKLYVSWNLSISPSLSDLIKCKVHDSPLIYF